MTTPDGANPQMTANNLKPRRAHPGEVLKDELEYRGIYSLRSIVSVSALGLPFLTLQESFSVNQALFLASFLYFCNGFRLKCGVQRPVGNELAFAVTTTLHYIKINEVRI